MTEEAVRAAGAHEVIIGADLAPAKAFGPYHLILESVGGASLSTSLTLLASHGTCVLFGVSAEGNTTLDPSAFYRTSASLSGFAMFDEITRRPVSQGLARLVRLIADGQLHPRIEVEAPWTSIADVARQLMDRRYPGKSVLFVTR